MKDKVGGQWWLKGEEHNDELIQFVNTWLNDWVGYVEETVFDVNMLSIDQNTIICNNYNKTVFDHFKKHKVEPSHIQFQTQVLLGRRSTLCNTRPIQRGNTGGLLWLTYTRYTQTTRTL